eukprot:jgi/Bigna1/73517/fgenesh1_pg.24_\
MLLQLLLLLLLLWVVKLSSSGPTWWNLSALEVETAALTCMLLQQQDCTPLYYMPMWHFESQCIPHYMSYYAHQLPPLWLKRLSVSMVYFILIGCPYLLYIPLWPLRHFSWMALASFQVLIILTGNYNFFNLLSLALLVPMMRMMNKKVISRCFFCSSLLGGGRGGEAAGGKQKNNPPVDTTLPKHIKLLYGFEMLASMFICSVMVQYWTQLFGIEADFENGKVSPLLCMQLTAHLASELLLILQKFHTQAAATTSTKIDYDFHH